MVEVIKMASQPPAPDRSKAAYAGATVKGGPVSMSECMCAVMVDGAKLWPHGGAFPLVVIGGWRNRRAATSKFDRISAGLTVTGKS